MNKAVLEEQANSLLKEHGIDAKDGFDIVSLAQKMGFVVGNAVLDDGEDGFIIVDTNRKSLLGTSANKVIGVNAKRDYPLKRFIIAHEIGHYVLEGCNEPIYAHRQNNSVKRSVNEQEVDFFAASLLMPQEAFAAKYSEISKEYELFSTQIDKLKEVFEAPTKSIIRRLEELGLIGIKAGPVNG